MKLPAGPPKFLSSDPCRCPSKLGTSLDLEKQRSHFQGCFLLTLSFKQVSFIPVGKTVRIKCYGGIAYSSVMPTPVVLAKARTCFFPESVLEYYSLETYEQAPNFMAAVRDVDENWDWVKKKYWQRDKHVKTTRA